MKVTEPMASREDKTMHDVEKLAAEAIECGFAIHRDLGPGLLE
jgi:hypothetical protein